jgi:FlaG/FlaF family flagellin (archaellin)
MTERKEDAVSPVVGVMLMLVVTIIIAAVVSGFAGGLAEGQEKAPQASLECKISENSMGDAYGYELVIKHLSGDPINTHDMKLVTSWVDSDGTFHTQATLPYNDTPNTDAWGSQYHEPYKVMPGDMPADGSGEEETLWFGNYIMRAGDVAKSTMNIGPDNSAGPIIIRDWADLTGNEVINVKLFDLKSGSMVYNKDIVVGV